MGNKVSNMNCFSSSQFNSDGFERTTSHSVLKRSPKSPKSPKSPTFCADHIPNPTRECVNVLFLDVDGVLNHDSTPFNARTRGIEDGLLKHLKMILDVTRCKIVLSTTWRLYPEFKLVLLDVLQTRGDMNVHEIIIGQTPHIPQCKRPTEIARFMKEYNANDLNKYQIDSFCVIDDLPLNKYSDSSFLSRNFVQTDPKTGISLFNVIECVQILRRNFIFDPYCMQD